MNITEELIERFFQDKCSAEDVGYITAYLDKHPDILEKYMGEEDWTAFKSSVKLHPAVSQKMLSAIRSSTYVSVKRRVWLRYVAAASVLLLAIAGIKYLIAVNDIKETNPVVNVSVEVAPVFKTLNNNTGKVEKIVLNDGSVIMLEANSELSYYEPFEMNKRSIYLKGEAFFKVAKDKTKPFTVYSNEIATTALGTEFRVRAFENSNTISVKLFEGKIVINSSDSVDKKLATNFYLLPGDEFSYNRSNLIAKITSDSKNNNKSVTTATNLKTDAGNNWFMFNNQNLANVFDQLSEIYGVVIKYNKAEVVKMYFIGKVTRQDSIENILDDIALLNDLNVIKTANGYTITRK